MRRAEQAGGQYAEVWNEDLIEPSLEWQHAETESSTAVDALIESSNDRSEVGIVMAD